MLGSRRDTPETERLKALLGVDDCYLYENYGEELVIVKGTQTVSVACSINRYGESADAYVRFE